MKKDFTVQNEIDKSDIFICVANYKNLNEVINYGFDTEKGMIDLKNDNDIGFWRIKRK